jgi:hypothetical protein
MSSDFLSLPTYTGMKDRQAGKAFSLVLSPESALEAHQAMAVAGLSRTFSFEDIADEVKRGEEDRPKTEIHYDDRPVAVPLSNLVDKAQQQGKELSADIRALKDRLDFYRLDVGFNVILPFQGGEQVEALALRVRLDPSGHIEGTGGSVHSVCPATEFADRLSREKLEAIEVLVTAGLALIPSLKDVPIIGNLLKIPSKILAAFPWKVARTISSGSNSGVADWKLEYQKIAGEVPLTMIVRVPKGTKQMDLLYSGLAKVDTSRWHRGRVYELDAKSVTIPLA